MLNYALIPQEVKDAFQEAYRAGFDQGVGGHECWDVGGEDFAHDFLVVTLAKPGVLEGLLSMMWGGLVTLGADEDLPMSNGEVRKAHRELASKVREYLSDAMQEADDRERARAYGRIFSATQDLDIAEYNQVNR